MDLAGESKNATIASDSITLAEAGYYAITYSLYPLFSTDTSSTLTFAVRSNGTNIESTVSLADAPDRPFYASYTGNTIVQLPAGAVIDVAVSSTADMSMSFDTGTTSSLTLYKLS